jgi:flagellar biosynthetic protein FlhB
MAEMDQEKTEQPTQKRLEEARERGEVPRSRELSAAAVVLIAGAALYMMGGKMAGDMHGIMRAALSLSREQALDETHAITAFGNLIFSAMWACMPVLALTMLAALFSPLAIGGWNLAFGTLAPDFSRLSPLSGLKRMFSPNNLVELVKAFAKFGIVGAVAVIFLWSKTADLLALGSQPLHQAIGHAALLSGQALIVLAGSLALIAAIDVPWQLFQYSKRLRMSKQEIRDEYKESEGSPEIKGRIRQAQQEMARRRMMQEVPKADVVVVNPTHFAVALRYDEKRNRAPVVVAKGVDDVAARIREIATENLVPIFEAPPLARALYRNVDLGAEIPATLYVAVAQVLTYVYQLRTARRNGEVPPQPPAIDPNLDETKH